jgi:hypothetical protein
VGIGRESTGGESAGSGAWPFLARGVTCLVDSANGRDLSGPRECVPERRCKVSRGKDYRRVAGGREAITGQ